MSLIQSIRNLNRVLQHLLQGQRAFEQARGERLALEIFHDEEIGAVLPSDVVQRADVRMIQAGDGASLALKPLSPIRLVSHMLRQHFDGDDSIQSGISSRVNLAHPARANRGKDFVRP